jgi:hypothetical protein
VSRPTRSSAAHRGAVDLVPAVVSLHVWGVPPRRIPAALAAMATSRRTVNRAANLTFVKLLGTSAGPTFTPRGADLRHWAVLACWSDPRAVEAFERSAFVHDWDRRANPDDGGERLRVLMRPLSSRGQWSERLPFGSPTAQPYDGPVAALTRARLRTSRTAQFWRAVPAVSARLATAPGLRAAIGIGEAPVGLQGTFSLWDDAEALQAFAYGTPEHADVVRRTPSVGWYREELFARFAVLEASGSLHGIAIGPVT